MFNNLSKKIFNILQKVKISGTKLTESNIKKTLLEVKYSLLEADVAFSVTNHFINRIKKQAIDSDLNPLFTPEQQLINIVKSELIDILGQKNEPLCLNTNPPAVFLFVGSKGSGKTTSVAKLSKYLYDKYNKKVLVASIDVYRQAAIKQLYMLTKDISGVDFFHTNTNNELTNIALLALQEAKLKFYDILLLDTVGYTKNDNKILVDILNIYNIVKPIETIFVADSMIGQDAANIAKYFNDTLPITSIILTKTDSDARGGAALSIRYITGKSIKFLCCGEKIDDLKPFYPDRLASSILGMGDIISLVEDIKNKVKQKSNKNNIKKNSFDLNDFLEQISSIRNIGNVSDIMNKIPKQYQFSTKINEYMDINKLIRMQSIIYSMTPYERKNPSVIKGSRKRRIAYGSGVHIQDVNYLLKQFEKSSILIKKINKQGISKFFSNIKNKFIQK